MSFNECSNILSSMSFNGDKQRNFFNYAYYKIAQNTKNRFVEKNSDSIDIILDKQPCIKVVPIYQEIDKETLNIKNEIEQAIDIISSSEFKYVYFIYPKNNKFDKHIQVKVPQLEENDSEYMIKLIPYSLKRLSKSNKCSVANKE